MRAPGAQGTGVVRAMSSPNKHRGRVAAWVTVLAVAGILAAWMMDSPAKPRRAAQRPIPYTISKETTWITEPLRPDGAVDYFAALNARLSEGVTPENNAAVLLMQVMGAEEIQPEIREEFYKQLGVPLPETTQGLWLPFDDFVDRYLETIESPHNEELREKLDDQFDEAKERPWTKSEFPVVAKWLDENKPAIELIVAASKRPRLHIANVPRNAGDSVFLAQISMISTLRRFEETLCVHAMHSLGEGQPEPALTDAMACHRLSTWGCDISADYYQMGIAIGWYEREIALALAESPASTPALLAKLRRDLAAGPSPTSSAEACDVFVRFTILEHVRGIETAAQAAKVGNWFDMPQALTWKRFGDMGLDLGLILTIINSQCSEVVEALKQPDYLSRKAALDKIEQEFQAFRKKSLDSNEVTNLILGRKPAQEVVSTQFAHEFCWFFLRGSSSGTETRSLMRRQITLLALTLAEYQREHGNYPAELAALVPKYVVSIPVDAFTLKPLIYQPRQDGYLLYSVGSNGRDDKGVEFSPDGELDDVAVRVPREPGS